MNNLHLKWPNQYEFYRSNLLYILIAGLASFFILVFMCCIPLIAILITSLTFLWVLYQAYCNLKFYQDIFQTDFQQDEQFQKYPIKIALASMYITSMILAAFQILTPIVFFRRQIVSNFKNLIKPLAIYILGNVLCIGILMATWYCFL